MEFTGEEGLGRYLDLHDLYLQFLNLRSQQQQRGKGGKAGKAAASDADGNEIDNEVSGAVMEKSLEYYEYLTSFSDFTGLPRQMKLRIQYGCVGDSLGYRLLFLQCWCSGK